MTHLPDSALITAVRTALAASADPMKAPKMQAYMKSDMPYHGVSAPAQEKIYRAVFTEHPIKDADTWMSTVLTLWRTAAFREEKYAAIALTGHRLYKGFQELTTLPMYEEMIVTGAWWDYVDAIATNRIGKLLLRSYPNEMKRTMLRWSKSDDLWKRRTSLICQVSFKADTDLGLLYACIEGNWDEKDFFIRKAIGWALRSYAWTDPEEISRYVAENGERLSGLSKREALKNIGKANRSTPI